MKNISDIIYNNIYVIIDNATWDSLRTNDRTHSWTKLCKSMRIIWLYFGNILNDSLNTLENYEKYI